MSTPAPSSEIAIPTSGVVKAALAAVLLGVAAWSYLGAARPPAADATRVGVAYRADIADAYAAKLLAVADAIAAGKAPIADVEKLGEDEFLRYRLHAFRAKIAPLLEAASGGTGTAPTDAARAAVARILRDVAAGLSPNHTPLAPSPPSPPPPPGPGPAPAPPADHGPTGWVDNPEARERLAATLPAHTLSEAAPDFFRADNDKDVFLYRAWKDVLGDYPKYPAQQIGDCTSFGSSHAIDLLQCIDIKIYGLDKGSYQETCTEATYGFSREEAGLLHSWGDGSFGVATGKALMEHGTVSRQFVGAGYSGSRAKQWGNAGCPDNVRTEAEKHKLGAATLVTTTDEADAALNNGYPFIVCSNQGFTMTRDETGTCQPRGSWGHCMFVAGKRHLDGTRQYLICQSWGPNTPSGPTTDDQPDFSFWCDDRTMQRILDEKDSMVFSRFAGFTARPLPDRWRFDGFAANSARKTAMADPGTLDGARVPRMMPPPRPDPFPRRELPPEFRNPAL